MKNRELLSVEDIAKATGRAEVTIRQMLSQLDKEGALPGERISKKGIFVIKKSLFLRSLTDGSVSRYFKISELAQIKSRLEGSEALKPKPKKEVA